MARGTRELGEGLAARELPGVWPVRLLERAREHLEAADSPLVHLAAFALASRRLHDGEVDRAFVELEDLRVQAETRGYLNLLGRVRRLRGFVAVDCRKSEEAAVEWVAALSCFEKTGEAENAAAIEMLLADGHEARGERDEASRRRQRARVLVGSIRKIQVGAVPARGKTHLPRTSRETVSGLARASKTPGPDLRAGDGAGTAFSRLRRARTHLADGREDAAEAELLAGLHEVEAESASGPLAAEFYDEMIRFQVERRGAPRRALAFLERSRVAEPPAFGPAGLEERMPADAALIAYKVFPDRLLTWVVTRGRTVAVAGPLAAGDLAERVVACRAALQGDTSTRELARLLARLHETLVRPITAILPRDVPLVFVPDGLLHAVPFAALFDPRSGLYLAEEHAVGLAPDAAGFVRASGAKRTGDGERRVVFLSRGDSAGSMEARGAATLRTAGSLLASGAAAATALWEIDDRAQALLAGGLDAALAAGEEPIEALRTAQLGLLASEVEELRSPSRWGALTIVAGFQT